jgi:hypothetical protein
VSHRNVCRIHEYGEDGNIRFLSMEFVEGAELKRLLRDGPLSEALGFEGCKPATLLFIQATAEQVHLPMELALGVIGLLLTAGTLADGNRQRCHEQLLNEQRLEDCSLYTSLSLHGKTLH